MVDAAEEAFLIVSDLHMSAGFDPRTRAYDRNEDFFYDDAFCRFIDYQLVQAEQDGQRLRLVILGDFIDFLQVWHGDPAHGVSSSAASVTKLERVAAGHPAVFAALGRVLTAGHHIDLVIGNHDVEFVWPDVQRRLRELIGCHTRADVETGITIHPWFLYVPGVLYAEHGHQYEAVNSFFAPLAPWDPADESEIDLPLGSHFVLDLYNDYIERVDPFADNVKPAMRYFAWVIRTHPLLALRSLPYYLRFIGLAVKKAGDLSAAERLERRQAYRENVLAYAEEQLGLPAATLAELDRLAETPTTAGRRRQLEALLEPVLPILPAAAGAYGVYHLMQRLRPANRVIAGIVIGLGLQAWRERSLIKPTTQPGGYLYRAACAINERLRQVDAAVPVYVFGHNHTAEQLRITEADDAPWYINTGTWTPILQQAFDLFADRERFTFVRVCHDPGDKSIDAELLIWNDHSGRAEPVLAIADRGWPMLSVEPSASTDRAGSDE
jgi:UDP-2,3-diacylglucosamine pyrophosphatase LpxH